MYIYVYIPGKKFNNDATATKNCNSSFGDFFLWFWFGFGNFTSFFAAFHRFKPYNDGNQLLI